MNSTKHQSQQVDLFSEVHVPNYLRLRTVLIIEDQVDLNNALALRLKSEGVDVYSAFDGFDGMRKLIEIDPDLVLLDLGLPGQNGFKLLHELRRQEGTLDTPMVIITGDPSPTIEQRARSWGVSDVIRKPFHQKNVVRTVLSILDGEQSASSCQGE